MKPLVLAVDDDQNDRRLIQRTLLDDFDVVVCGSGEEALAIMEASDTFDVILADYHLPGISGIEFIERAALLQPTAGRLIITGDRMSRRLFPVVTLFKPVPPAALLSFVHKLATLSQRSRAAREKATRPTDPMLTSPVKKKS